MFRSPRAGSPPANCSTGDQWPAAVQSPRDRIPPHKECTAAGDWSPVLPLPGKLPTCGDSNMTKLISITLQSVFTLNVQSCQRIIKNTEL